jgi:diaminohydroxyphosphoribosylaminopyrimidine deaminase/5-amino-6-(5-phosphoribosylamino)uracil reductase
LKLRRVVISTLDPIKNHSGGVEILKSSGVEVELGVEEKRAKELIEPFVIWQERAFVVFKLAQSLNGRIGGGYLSSKESLTHTHKIREVIDMLIIGGNTVRTDRPTLDCRFSNPSKAPNVTIFSKKGSFEPDIPLFGVKNREVRVTQSLDFSKPSLVLVEGGEGLLNSLKSSIDWSLHYITPQLSSNQISYNCTQKLTFLHQERVGVDFILWSRFEQ